VTTFADKLAEIKREAAEKRERDEVKKKRARDATEATWKKFRSELTELLTWMQSAEGREAADALEENVNGPPSIFVASICYCDYNLLLTTDMKCLEVQSSWVNSPKRTDDQGNKRFLSPGSFGESIRRGQRAGGIIRKVEDIDPYITRVRSLYANRTEPLLRRRSENTFVELAQEQCLKMVRKALNKR